MESESRSSPIAPARSRRMGVRLLTLLLAPLLSLLLIEVGLRWANGRGQLDGWLYMSGAHTKYSDVACLDELLLGHRRAFPPLMRTGDFRLNSKGLRTIEYEVEKPPGVYRIVVLGDSHTWRSGGMPFPDLWHSRLREHLEVASDLEIELISLGVPAIGPAFELRMWELEGMRLSADLVVLAFSIGNDFLDVRGKLADETRMDRWARRSLTVRLVRNYQRLRAVGQDLSDGVHGGSWRTGKVGGLPGEFLAEVVLDYDRLKPKYSAKVHRELVTRRLVNSRRRGSAGFRRAAEHLETIIDSLHSGIVQCGAELVILAIPDEYQVDAELLAEVVEARGDPLDNYEVDRPQRVLSEICTSRGILLVDTLGAIREAAGELPMFNFQEVHMNDYGHAILATELSAAIVEGGLLH